MDWIEYELPLHSKDGTIRATITLVHNPVRLLSMYHIAVDGRRNQQATRKFFAFCRDLDGHLASNKNGRVVSQAAVEFVVFAFGGKRTGRGQFNTHRNNVFGPFAVCVLPQTKQSNTLPLLGHTCRLWIMHCLF
mmetsp:Transcript_24221/g.53036  ORF Transcript_24221/g.53036 Transcript_24221/m.53036 type:complete len:134 (-) Transcript_24221:91-492(-)